MLKQTPNTTSTLRKQLLCAGFNPIPVIGKIPTLKAWQTKTETNGDEIDLWDKDYPNAESTGLLTRKMPTFDIDIKNPEAANAVEKLVRAAFEEHGIILVRIGNAPRRAIPFRTEAPFAKITENLTAPDGSEGQKLELLADGQQVVAFGIHKDTREPYTWVGGEPGEINYNELPCLSEEQARALVEESTELLIRDHGYKRAVATPRRRPVADKIEIEIEINVEKVIAALKAATNDNVDEDLWFRIMAAAHVGSAGDEEAYRAFANWSALSSKHDKRRTWQRWKAFSNRPPRDIGPGTLYAHANETAPGWREAMIEEAYASIANEYASAIAATKNKPSGDGGRNA